jgi:phosphoglucosamine mutase
MNDEPNGKNINDRCGAVYPQAMAKRVVQEKATIGIALDGDGDRAIFSDEKGEIVNGDVVMAIAAVYLKSKGLLNKHGLVVTLMSNYGLRASLEKHGIHLVQTDVGDRYVVEAMRKGGYNLGGEQSGHLIFLDHNTTGDGIITMLQLLAVAIESQKPLSELSKVMQQFPQALVNVPVREKRDLKSLPKVKKLIDEVELSLGSSGRINVRYSGTENLARVMVEGERQEVIQKYADAVAAVIHEAVGKI